MQIFFYINETELQKSVNLFDCRMDDQEFSEPNQRLLARLGSNTSTNSSSTSDSSTEHLDSTPSPTESTNGDYISRKSFKTWVAYIVATHINFDPMRQVPTIQFWNGIPGNMQPYSLTHYAWEFQNRPNALWDALMHVLNLVFGFLGDEVCPC